MKKIILIILCSLVSACVNQQYGYLIFDIYSVDESVRKNYSLGLYGKVGTVHVSSKVAIRKVIAGNYKIDHIDRSNGSGFSAVVLRSPGDGEIEFKVKPNSINYLGVLLLERANSQGEYDLSFSSGGGLISRACDQSPDLFELYSVNLAIFEINGRTEFKYDCASGSVEL